MKTYDLVRVLVASAVCLTASGAAAQEVAAPAEKSPWEGSAALGFTVTRGNSKTLSLNANVALSRKTTKNELLLGADGTYGEDSGTKNAQALHGFVQDNILFTDRFYGYLRVDALHDEIADIDYRVAFSPGAGYYFIKSDHTRLSGEIGPGYVIEKVGGVNADYPTLRAGERFEHRFNDRVKVWQSVEYLPRVEDFSDYVINGEVGVENALSKALSLRVFAQDTYRNQPAAGRQKNDLKVVTAIAYKF